VDPISQIQEQFLIKFFKENNRNKYYGNFYYNTFFFNLRTQKKTAVEISIQMMDFIKLLSKQGFSQSAVKMV